MIALTIYRPSTGEILRQFTTDDLDSVLMNIGDDEEAVEGSYTADLWYISEGDPVAMPESPGDWAVWNWDTHSWDDPRDAAWHADQLAEAKAAALAQITAMRGQARLVYITDLPGQEALYIAKLEEAREYLADEYPDIAEYPLIASEVGITAPTAFEVAQIFANLNALWKQAAGQIDGVCFLAEFDTITAVDVAGVEAAVEQLKSSLAGSPS